jgi:hypothetical protein
MHAFLKSVQSLNVEDLLDLSEAIFDELERRQNRTETIPDSARRRSSRRRRSYRRSAGSAAPPIRVIGLRDIHSPRVA